MKTIVLTGGGTAGHCLPNIALLPQLKESFDKIYYIGSNNGLEKNLATSNGLEYFAIPCAKLDRSLNVKNLTIPFNLINGVIKAGKILDKLKPNIIFSKGGYVALPVVFAAKKRNIPIVCHESDLTLGLANKISSRYSKKTLTSFPETAKEVKNGLYLGSPLRKSLFSTDKKKALKQFNLSGDKPIILITGGSLGSKAINKAVRNSLNLLLEKYDIIHQCGKNNLDKNIQYNGYIQTEFISDMNNAYGCADVCISRAGANTVFELLSLKKPSILIPLPKGTSRGDQVLNAEYFQRKGLVYVLPQNVLTPESLTLATNSVYSNRVTIRKRLEKMDFESANEKIVNILNELSIKSYPLSFSYV